MEPTKTAGIDLAVVRVTFLLCPLRPGGLGPLMVTQGNRGGHILRQCVALSHQKQGLNPMAVQLLNHDPQYWRDLAQQKREMAERMQSTEARASFMNAAQHYEQMTKRVEAISEEPDEPDSLGG